MMHCGSQCAETHELLAATLALADAELLDFSATRLARAAMVKQVQGTRRR